MTGTCRECGRSPPRSDSEASDMSFQKIKAEAKNKAKDDQDDINPYPEIVIPSEFLIKFETDKKMDFGSILTAEREVQDEMRIRFLQMQYKHLTEFHEKEIREMEIRMRNKVHGYARACIQTLC